MNPLNLELVPVLRLDRPLKLTLWNPVKNHPDFHLDLLLLQPIISQRNPDSHLDLRPLLKLIAIVNHQLKNLRMKTNPRTKNHLPDFLDQDHQTPAPKQPQDLLLSVPLKKHLQPDSLLAPNPKIPQIPPLPVLVSEPEIATQDPDFRLLEAVTAVTMPVVKLDLPLVQRHLQGLQGLDLLQVWRKRKKLRELQPMPKMNLQK